MRRGYQGRLPVVIEMIPQIKAERTHFLPGSTARPKLSASDLEGWSIFVHEQHKAPSELKALFFHGQLFTASTSNLFTLSGHFYVGVGHLQLRGVLKYFKVLWYFKVLSQSGVQLCQNLIPSPRDRRVLRDRPSWIASKKFRESGNVSTSTPEKSKTWQPVSKVVVPQNGLLLLVDGLRSDLWSLLMIMGCGKAFLYDTLEKYIWRSWPFLFVGMPVFNSKSQFLIVLFTKS